MRAMHDSPLLMPADLSSALAASDLHDQVERVRTTPQPLSLEEMSKLWMTFQTQYRLSAAYQVSVVLIESTRRKRTALPVRAPNLFISTFRRPILESVEPQVVLPGDTLTISGQNLDVDALKVRFGAILQDPDSATPLKLVVTTPAAVRAGVNTVQVVQKLMLGRPPVAAGAGLRLQRRRVHRRAEDHDSRADLSWLPSADLTLAISPPVGREQRVRLFVGDRSIPLPARAANAPATTASLTFSIPTGITAEFVSAARPGRRRGQSARRRHEPTSATFSQYRPDGDHHMTDVAAWRKRTTPYLQAALAWLRLRLAHQAGVANARGDGGCAAAARATAPVLDAGAAPPEPTATKRSDGGGSCRRRQEVIADATNGNPPPALLSSRGDSASRRSRNGCCCCAPGWSSTRASRHSARAPAASESTLSDVCPRALQSVRGNGLGYAVARSVPFDHRD
jgi:hypothetical protein